MAALSVGLTFLLSYLIGAVPFGYLVARSRGVDIRKHGSGNIGATNVGRVLGKPYGVLVFLLDFAKGAAPALLAAKWTSGRELALPADSLSATAAAAAFLGHLFPIYLRFRGGKGVATAAGAVCVLVPIPAVAAVAAWFVVVLASRYVSLASMSAAVVLCVVRLLSTPSPWNQAHRVVTLFCAIAAALIFVRHRANASRLLRGNENRLRESRSMLQIIKITHVLIVGLWFGSVIFFSFVVGLNLFGPFAAIAAKTPADRPLWLPLWDVYDGQSPHEVFPDPLRKEQGIQAAGAAIHPLFQWYFVIQAVCAVLATATALAMRGAAAGRVHSIRVVVLLAALLTVALGWWLDRVVDDLREPRNDTFQAMVSHSPPRNTEVRAAVEARQTFIRWHLYSLGLNMLAVVLVTIVMAQAAYLPDFTAKPPST